MTFLTSALLSFVLALPVRLLLQRAGVVDRPTARSSHSQTTVRGGGIAIMIVLLVMGTVIAVRHHDATLSAFLVAALILGGVSFLDDLRNLPRWTRFVCHIGCAGIALVATGLPILSLALMPDNVWVIPKVAGWALVLFWICGYTNAFNFMDGINGIAATQIIVTATSTALVALAAGAAPTHAPVLFAWTLAGAAAGFLPWNFPRARMFMGDVGSAPLGFLLAALIIWVAARYGGWLLVPLLLLHANYMLDTSITLTRRVLRGERWYEPHREHFYQRLVRSGKTHAFTTLCELGLQLVVGLMIVAHLAFGGISSGPLIIVVVGIWIGFFAYCEVRFQRANESVGRLNPAREANAKT